MRNPASPTLAGKVLRKMGLLFEKIRPRNIRAILSYRRQFFRRGHAEAPAGFSIVLVTRNRRQFLEWAAAAVLTQTREPFELIIMDNASDDGTREAARALEQAHPGTVRYVRLDRNYGTNAYALGFLRARYPYLVDMDDDILALAPGWDAAVIEAFRAVPRLGFLALNVIQDTYTNGAKPEPAHYVEKTFSGVTLQCGPTGGWFAITTRAIYNEVGGFCFQPYKPFHMEDGLYTAALARRNYFSAILADEFVYHACGPYWNSAYGYHRAWHDKYRQDHAAFLAAIADTRVDEVPTLRYAQECVAQAASKFKSCIS